VSEYAPAPFSENLIDPVKKGSVVRAHFDVFTKAESARKILLRLVTILWLMCNECD
jgi:hypothetical protein